MPALMPFTTVALAREAVNKLRDHARLHGMDHRERDPLVIAIHAAIDLADPDMVTCANCDKRRPKEADYCVSCGMSPTKEEDR